ncbi:hypothetical protein KKG46_00100 [Patescibacteria group bacterium]|nr:hypothetical protein [Patescibacteria group bacterium]
MPQETQLQPIEKASAQAPKWLIYSLSAIPWLIVFILFIWVLRARFPLSGIFETKSQLIGQSAFIYPFLPAERTIIMTKDNSDWVGQRILGDPVYLNARIPGSYDSVDVEMEFKTIHQPLVEFGVVHDAAGKNLELQPWYSSELENNQWRQVKSPGGISGMVLNDVPASRLDDHDVRGLAAWLATSTAPLMADVSLVTSTTVKLSLRGAHDFWVVPADGQIKMDLLIQDVNRNRNGGLLAISITKDDQMILQDAVGTGGTQDDGYGSVIPVKINQRNLAPGVYRVKIIADDDVFIRSLTTSNPRWVVGPRLYVGDVVGYATSSQAFTAYTTARHIVAETFHKEGLQTITFGPVEGKVQRTHTAVRIDRDDSISTPVVIQAPKGDIRIIADGFFTFTETSFFEPQPRRFTADTSGADEGIMAVLTDYDKVQHLDGEWVAASSSFTVPKNVDTMRFVLSAPGIVSRAGAVDIRNITMRFHRQPMTFVSWWNLILDDARRLWHRL